MNLIALHTLLPEAGLTGVEINRKAAEELSKLPDAYDILYRASRRYILVCEYDHPTPVKVEYRGNRSVLFKRDFAGDLLERFPDLELTDYGFVYKKDPHNLEGDDFTWFLMRKP